MLLRKVARQLALQPAVTGRVRQLTGAARLPAPVTLATSGATRTACCAQVTATWSSKLARPLPLALAATVTGASATTLALGVSLLRVPSSHCDAEEAAAAAPPPEAPRSLTARRWWGERLWFVGQLVWRCGELCVYLSPAVAWAAARALPGLGRVFSRQRLLALLVWSLARCGPMGIKWGQWASTRYDLFEDDFCEALGALTNQAPAHSYEHSRKAVEHAFQRPLEEIFDTFEREPLASASIAQVHVATLRGGEAETVAVKVQHPNLQRRLELDMALLRGMSLLAERLAPDLRIGETTDQFALNFAAQLDFNLEASNLERFAGNFSTSFWRTLVSFPQPVAGLVSREVLVETFEEGESVAKYLMRAGDRAEGKWERDAQGRWFMLEKSDDVNAAGTVRYAGSAEAGDLRSSVALVGVQAYLKMLIWDNYIHADLHPGNVLIREQRIGWLQRLQRWAVIGDSTDTVPHIVLLDAGLAASFNQDIFGTAQAFFQAVVDCDGPGLGAAILGLAPAQPYVEARPQGRELFIAEVARKCAGQKEEFDRGEGRPGDNIRAYMDSVRAHRVVLDPTVLVALMSMLVLEGWQYRLDPAVSVLHCLESATGSGVFGTMQRLHTGLKDLANTVFG